MTESRFFSRDYAEARKRFVAAALAARAGHTEMPLDVRGPSGERLSLNLAYLGAEIPTKLLLHTSGIHGVEGFAGSAIQIAALESAIEIPEGVGVVFVHALNPFGMAWSRRVNENNVDLNRNFLGSGEAYSGSDPRYENLGKILNARPAPDWFWPQILFRLSHLGFTALKNAIVRGRYDFPEGLFFGGHELQQSSRLYKEWLFANCGSPAQVLAIDVHTGLGKFGEEVLFCHNNGTVPDFGKPFTTIGSTIGYKARGGLETLTGERFAQAKWIHFTQEFGTHSMPSLLKALREENLQFREKADGGKASARLLVMMNPKDEAWRIKVVVEGVDTLKRALAWLAR